MVENEYDSLMETLMLCKNHALEEVRRKFLKVEESCLNRLNQIYSRKITKFDKQKKQINGLAKEIQKSDHNADIEE